MGWADGSVFKRGRIFYVQYYRHGKCFQESSHSENERDARRLLKQRLAEAASPKFVGPSEQRFMYSDMEKGLVDDWRIKQNPALKSLPYWLRHLKRHFGNDRAIDITVRRINAFIDAMRAAGKSNATINRSLTALKRMFTIAIRSKQLREAPYIQLLDETAAIRKGFLEPADFARVRDALPDYLKDPVDFLYRSAWRKGEMRSLEWRDVNMEDREIRLRAENSKNGHERLLMLEGELFDIIARAYDARRPDCRFVFHYGGGRPIGDFRKAWKKAVREAALDPEKLVVHDLRRSGVRNAIRGGTPEHIVMAQSGHRTHSMLMRYNIVSPDDLRAAARRTDEYIKSQKAAKVIPLRKAG
jgi:integrase